MSEQSKQFAAFIRRKKNLCVIEQRKDAEVFAEVINHTRGRLSAHYHVHLWHTPEGVEAVLAWEFKHIHRYVQLLGNRAAWATQRDVQQARLGEMFGYDKHEVQVFIDGWTPDFCQCSRCVGIHTAEEVKTWSVTS